MPTIDRATVIQGPAKITFGGQSFWSKGDITLNPINERFGIETSTFGPVDERIINRQFDVSFEPTGRFTTALAAVLWPYPATVIGADVFGASDAALVINTQGGTQITVHNAAVTAMPNIRLGVGETIQGNITITGLLANSTDPSNAAAYYTTAAVTYPGDTGFAVSDVKTNAYASAWGSSPWDDFHTEAGWDIAFALELAPKIVDGLGTIGMTLQSLAVTASSIPVGVTEAQVLTALKSTGALGSSIATTDDLTMTGTGVFVSLSNAGMQESEMGFGSERKRIGQTTWMATRTIDTGTPDPLFIVSDAAPV